MIPKPAMWRVAEGWNQNIGCAYILNPYFSVWKPERCFGAFKTPESLKEPRFLGNGCYREQKAKLPPIHRRSWRHWAFVFRFLAVNIIWPKLSVVCIIYPISLNTMNMLTPLDLCLVHYAQYAKLSTLRFFIPTIINSDTFSEESEEKTVSQETSSAIPMGIM